MKVPSIILGSELEFNKYLVDYHINHQGKQLLYKLLNTYMHTLDPRQKAIGDNYTGGLLGQMLLILDLRSEQKLN